MKAVFAATINNADPLAALEVGELPEPQPRPFWSTVSVKAATVNHHDIWSLKGVGLAAEATPDDPRYRRRRRARRGHSRAQGAQGPVTRSCCTP